jgi:hypothetical protein
MKILFAAGDPGGANAVVPVAAAFLARYDEVMALVNPLARAIFAAHNIPISDTTEMSSDPLDTIVDRFAPDCIVTSTSVGESMDKELIRRFKDIIPCVGVVDFWSNYSQRFSNPDTHDLVYVPNVICVVDELMRDEMIADGFSSNQIVVTGNPHFDHFADAITCAGENAREILFISQPLRDQARVPGFVPLPFDEHTALMHLIASVARLGHDYRISIRLHPKENPHSFDTYSSEFVSLATSATLEQAISRAGLIVGMLSPVLIQARAAGKSVLSYEPGLMTGDPLVSNRLGITTRVSSPAELDTAVAMYASGITSETLNDVRSVWPIGATERVLDVVLAQCLKK